MPKAILACKPPYYALEYSPDFKNVFLQAELLLFKIFPGYQAFILSIFAGYQERDLPDAAEGGGGGEGDGVELQGGAEVNTKAKK